MKRLAAIVLTVALFVWAGGTVDSLAFESPVVKPVIGEPVSEGIPVPLPEEMVKQKQCPSPAKAEPEAEPAPAKPAPTPAFLPETGDADSICGFLAIIGVGLLAGGLAIDRRRRY